MSADEATYEHTDLVLAATVSLHGGIEGAISRKGHQVVWTYPQSDRLTEFLLQFHSGSYRVEPLAFSKMLRSTRNRVYDLMGYDPPRVHSAATGPQG